METRLLTLYSTSNFILSQNSKFLGVNPFPDKVHRQTPEPLSSLARLLELLENGTICTGHPTSSAVQPSAPTSVAMRFVADRPWPTSRKPPPPPLFSPQTMKNVCILFGRPPWAVLQGNRPYDGTRTSSPMLSALARTQRVGAQAATRMELKILMEKIVSGAGRL
ncbi:hypothetical protein VTN31DRAFT_7443 [Thermomyces dupontii]|uniref:uncharacterized protein n=1 Tax=Talaromyces thermophilus TaxID=28565 RepID=UPI003744814D